VAITAYREWSSTPVTTFTLAAAGQQDAADDVHLPQLHRQVPLPPLVILTTPATRDRVDQPVPDQHPVDRRQARHRTRAAVTTQLELDPALPHRG
jgi:hypothetical protein